MIAGVRGLVYAENEKLLADRYNYLIKSDPVKKYPKFISYVSGHWPRRKEWALCFRKHLLVRGNHTNNYAEAGIKILKELIFNRVKAYNHVQMFSFVTECLELYYTRKLLSVAHNRIDRYISIKFQGLKSANISREHITLLDSEAATYLVASQTERGVKCLVNMELGVCSCNAGRDGSPCSHQAAIVRWYHVQSINCVPVLSPETRQKMATIALGSTSIQSPTFYSSLHEKSLAADVHDLSSADMPVLNILASPDIHPDTELDEDSSVAPEDCINIDTILSDIDEVVADIKARIADSSVVAKGTKVFLKRYKEMIKQGSLLMLLLAVHCTSLAGFLVGQCAVHRVDICAVAAESPSAQRQLVVDVASLLEERLRLFQVDQRV